MENQVPICSHTFQFYSGTSTELDHLEAQFKKALNAHVKYFGPSKKQSVFIVFVNSKTNVVGKCLRLQLEEYFDAYRKKNLESKMPTHKEALYYSDDLNETLRDSFSYRTFSTEGMEADELQELIMSIADGHPEATDSEGNHSYLFDISDAWPEQAFTVCKSSALIPLYTIVFPPKGSGRSTSYILPPFPSYSSFDDQQKSVLEFLNENHPDGDEDKDYLTYELIRSEVCNLPKKPNAKFNNLVPRYVASKRVKVEGHTRKVKAYRITDEGTFILRYLSRDSRLSDNS